MKLVQSQHWLPFKDMAEVGAQVEEDQQEVLDIHRHEEEVDKEAAEHSADSAKPQGAPSMSTPTTTSLTVTGGPKRTLKTSEL